jgi:coniferyl-aldehyde dehydrogenase
MAAAAENLVPVLLELGGKSPVVVHSSAPLKDVAERLTFGKLWNAGQTCVAPDYVFLPRGKTSEFVAQMRKVIQSAYPTLRNNPDYTSIVNSKQFNRLESYLDDAREKGAQIIEINPANEDLSGSFKIAPTLITGLTEAMAVCQNELFGPILLIHEYDHIDETIEYINDRPRPLAMYYFDYDTDRAEALSHRTHSGHFGVNAVITHVAQDDLPFGGVGASGMGKYHGHEGFLTMSHSRSVMVKPKLYALRMILPPFNKPIHKIMFKALLR